MAFEDVFTLRSVALNAAAFTDLAAAIAIDCNTITVINKGAVDIYLRSDPANAASEATIEPGLQFEIGGHRHSHNKPCRFLAGSQVCALKAASGNPTILVECVK